MRAMNGVMIAEAPSGEREEYGFEVGRSLTTWV